MARWNPFSRSDSEKQIKSGPRSFQVELKSALGETSALGSFLMFGTETAATAAGAISLYERSSAVSNPVHMVADQFQLLEPVLRRVGSNDVIEDHPLLNLLRRPSPDFTQELFFHKIATDFLVTGETAIAAIGNTKFAPSELQPLSPSSLSVVEGNGGYAKSWIVSGRTMTGNYDAKIVDRVRRFFRDNLTEVRVVKRYSTKNDSLLRGQSVLCSAAKDVRQNIAGSDYNLSLLNDGGRLSLVFHFEEDMNDEVWEATKERIRSSYGGPKGEKIGITSGGKMNIQQMSTSNREMDFERLQQMTKFAVAVAYHIPLPLLTTDAMTFNNMGEAKLMLFDDAVVPLAKKIFGDLGAWLLPRFGEDPNVLRLTYDAEQIEPLIDRRNARLKARRDLNIESTNELRRELPNRPDVEGGNSVLVSGTLVKLEELSLDLGTEGLDVGTNPDDDDETEGTQDK